MGMGGSGRRRTDHILPCIKAPPKSGRSVPTHAAVGGRGIPVHALGGRGVPVHAVVGGQGAPTKIASGSSGDDASLASKDDFVSKEEDDKRDPDDGLVGKARFAHDEIVVEARFALGFLPSDEARAAAARLSDAEVVRGAVAALRDRRPKRPLATTLNLTRDPRPEPTGMPSEGTPRMMPAGPPSRKPTAHAAPKC
jgi:hypothetical protein